MSKLRVYGSRSEVAAAKARVDRGFCVLLVNLPEATLEPNIPLPPLSLQVLRDSLEEAGIHAACRDLAPHGSEIARRMKASDFEALFRANREHGVLTVENERGLDLTPACRRAVEDSGLVIELLEAVERHRPVLVGFSLQGTPASSDLFAVGLCKHLAGELRRVRPDVSVVVGGARTVEKENVQQELLLDPSIDYVVRGNGHNSIRELALGVAARTLDPSTIRGLVYRTADGLARNQADPPWGNLAVPIWLDQAALPHYRRTIADLSPRTRHVPELADRLDRAVCAIPFQFTIGCVSECAFCNRASEAGKVSSPVMVADILERAVGEYGVRDFLFLNSELNFGRTYVHRFCEELHRRKLDIRWVDSCEFRGMDADTLELLRDAGCVALWFGLESVSDRVLSYIHKRSTAADAVRILEEADRLGIYSCLNFICGLPSEREEDVLATLRFIEDHREIIDATQVNVFFLQGGPFVDAPERFGLSLRGYQEQVGSTMCRAFDETFAGGLRWEEKKHQMLSSFSRVMALNNRLFPTECRNMPLVLALHRAFDGDKRMIQRAIRRMGDPTVGNFLVGASRVVQQAGESYIIDLRREAVLRVNEAVARCAELRHLRIWGRIRDELAAEFSTSDASDALASIQSFEAEGFFHWAPHNPFHA